MTIRYRETINVACITCYWILCNGVAIFLPSLYTGRSVKLACELSVAVISLQPLLDHPQGGEL